MDETIMMRVWMDETIMMRGMDGCDHHDEGYGWMRPS